MIFEQIVEGGCRSYLFGCAKACAAVLIDPKLSLEERYLSLASKAGVQIQYVLETHTHADHFSGAKELAKTLEVPVVMHRDSPAPFADMRLDDGDTLRIGRLRLTAMHTPGHTADSLCFVAKDRVFTGDTLLIGGTGRTDLPSGSPRALYKSLFEKLLKLPPETLVFPAHEYKGRDHSTIGEEIANNPRLQGESEAAFVDLMEALDLKMPTHLTEALRVNMSGGTSVSQLLEEAEHDVPFLSMDDAQTQQSKRTNDFVLLDVREKEAFEKEHIPGAINLPRGQLELRVNEVFPDPTVRIVTYCQVGKISVLAAATLRRMGFTRTSALDGSMEQWRVNGLPVEKS